MHFTDKSFDIAITKAADGVHDASFVMSSSAPDRVKDTIDPAAYKPSLGKRLIALWQHSSYDPIGFWDNLRVEAGKLKGDIKFATTELAQMVKTLINDGVPLGASIGFRGKGTDNKIGGIHFTELELLECSVVSVPCHPHAMQIAKSFGFDLEAISKPVQLHTRAQKVALSRAAAAVKQTQSLISPE